MTRLPIIWRLVLAAAATLAAFGLFMTIPNSVLTCWITAAPIAVVAAWRTPAIDLSTAPGSVGRVADRLAGDHLGAVLVGRGSRLPVLVGAIVVGLVAGGLIVALSPVIPGWLTTILATALVHVGRTKVLARLGVMPPVPGPLMTAIAAESTTVHRVLAGKASTAGLAAGGLLRGVLASVVRSIGLAVVASLAVGWGVIALYAIIAVILIAPRLIRDTAARIVRA